MPFARAVVDLIEEMKASSRGQPELGGPLHVHVFTGIKTVEHTTRVSTIDSQKDLIGN